MADQKCPSCGAELKPEVLGGLCPKCVLGKVMEEPHETVASSLGESPPSPGAESGQSPTAPPLGEQAGDRIGRYKLLQKIEEGGMGVVWMAEQTEPIRRMVALKVIKPGMDSAQVLARFEAERQALALMDHPNIAKVLDAGATPSGRPYFVMELVKGGLPITRFCDEERLSLEERLQLFTQVCQGVQHAHQKGIIHRDLKPGNVLIALYDGVPVPKIIDFGVAKALGQQLTERTLYTEHGSVLGTYEYMAPEQAELNQLDVDTRSDIYSLGVLLYELLTGTTPLTREAIRRAALDEVLRWIREKEPPTPSLRLSTSAERLQVVSAQRKLQPKKLTKTVRGELDWIVMKALDKDRSRRYDTASNLAADVLRYLRDEPVQAGPPTVRYRLEKFVRKHRAEVAVAAGFVGLLVVSSIVSTSLAIRATRAERAQSLLRQQADYSANAETHAKNQVEIERQRMEEFLDEIEADRAEQLFNAGESASALTELAQGLRRRPNNRMAAGRLMSALTYRRFAYQLFNPLKHNREVVYAEFSPDGQLILTASDKMARVWDVCTGQPVSEPFKHNGTVLSGHFSPDGQRVVTCSGDGLIHLWDLRTGELFFTMEHNVLDNIAEMMMVDGKWTFFVLGDKHSRFVTAQFSPDGKRLLTASEYGSARIWDALTGQCLSVLRHHWPVYSAQFSPDAELVATACPRYAQIWDASSGHPLSNPLKQDGIVRSVEFSPNGQQIVTAAGDSARVWNVRTSEPVTEPLKHTAQVGIAHFSPDGQQVVTAAGDSARVWNVRTGKPVAEPLKHTAQVGIAHFSPDAQRILTASGDYASVWDAQTGNRLSILKHNGSVSSVQFRPDGLRVLTASHDKTARVWDTQTGELVLEPLRHQDSVHFACFTSDGQRVLTTSDDGTARVWDLRARQILVEPLKHTKGVLYARFSPDAQLVVTASSDMTIRVWNARTGRPITQPLEHKAPVNSVRFSHDGRRIVSASQDTTACVWDARTGQLLIEPLKHDGPVISAQFSPDGHRVLTASDKMARVWDARNGRALTEPLKHISSVFSACFSPDGRQILTASHDHTARVWEADTGKLVTTALHGGPVDFAQFSPDGGRFLTTWREVLTGYAQVCDARTGRPITQKLRHDTWVISADFAPDGQQLVTVCEFGFSENPYSAKVWNLSTSQLVTDSIKHNDWMISAQFSPDGRRVLTASRDRTARVWDARNGRPLTEPLSQNGLRSAQFSPNGQWMVTASADGMARVWEIPVVSLPIPEWVLDAAEWAAGEHLSEHVRAQSVPASQLSKLKNIVTGRWADTYTALAQWFFADPAVRTISPFSPITVPEYVQRRIEENTLESLKEALSLAPTNGLAFARLAKQVMAHTDQSNPRRVGEADFFSRYALKWSPNDPEVKRIRDEIVVHIKAAQRP